MATRKATAVAPQIQVVPDTRMVKRRGPQDCPGQGMHPRTRDAKSGLGVCPTCGKIVALKSDGNVRGHKPMQSGFGETVVQGVQPAVEQPTVMPSEQSDGTVEVAHRQPLMQNRMMAIAELTEWLELLTGLDLVEIMQKRRQMRGGVEQPAF